MLREGPRAGCKREAVSDVGQVAFVEAEREAGRPVYVHCRAGISRSGMVVVASLMSRNGWLATRAAGPGPKLIDEPI